MTFRVFEAGEPTNDGRWRERSRAGQSTRFLTRRRKPPQLVLLQLGAAHHNGVRHCPALFITDIDNVKRSYIYGFFAGQGLSAVFCGVFWTRSGPEASLCLMPAKAKKTISPTISAEPIQISGPYCKLGTVVTFVELPGLAPLPWWQTLVIFSFAMLSCLMVNDAVKVAMMKWFAFGTASEKPMDLTPQIAKRAYQLCKQRGRVDGQSDRDWLEAKREIRSNEPIKKPTQLRR